MIFSADLHLHSRYAIGTSPALSLETLSEWAVLKGIDLLATGDFTHPAWLAELKERLEPLEGELFQLRGAAAPPAREAPRFVLGTELSCVYEQGGRSHRVHVLVFAPDFGTVDRLCDALGGYGALASDGRPMLSLSVRDLAELVMGVSDRCEMLPAHVWTPWYSALGSKGGFGSLAECFGDMLPVVHAVETGLSSDPAMNWRVPELEELSLVSFSDAHSPQKLGRELTAFSGEPSYERLREALREQGIAYTVEFFPEEGKYHYDGHRRCGVSQHPATSIETGGRCPVCGKPLTLGVLHRIEALAEQRLDVKQSPDGPFRDPLGKRPPFYRLVPLAELMARALGRSEGSRAVQEAYARVVAACGSELDVLLKAGHEEIAAVAGEAVADAIIAVRHGRVAVSPGYDGVYGRVEVLV